MFDSGTESVDNTGEVKKSYIVINFVIFLKKHLINRLLNI